MAFRLMGYLAVLAMAFSWPAGLSADEIYLKNGDKITGVITRDNGDSLIVRAASMGEIPIKKKAIHSIKSETRDIAPEIKSEELWQGEISIGYNQSGGNTQNSRLAGSICANRKTYWDEVTFKGYSYLSSSQGKMDSQQYAGMIRYAFSFGNRKWYSFHKVEAGHDKFADIELRSVLSTGAGYWISDKPPFKAMLEMGAGYQRTSFETRSRAYSDSLLIPRVFLEKIFFQNSRLTLEVFLYPSLKNLKKCRLHSETAFINPVTEKLSLRLSLIDDYNSMPESFVRKNDIRMMVLAVYAL
ncbi:MAG: DUF481 domain-containing protein [Elusimicrobia bacterium]|nr:DUF481 domain-containing protein [Elusimicrobiota bacterium]